MLKDWHVCELVLHNASLSPVSKITTAATSIKYLDTQSSLQGLHMVHLISLVNHHAPLKQAASPVDVVFPVGWQVIVDDQGHLLHVNTTRQQIGGDQHTGWPRAELAHDDVTFLLVHVAVLNKQKTVWSRNLFIWAGELLLLVWTKYLSSPLL